MTHNQIVGAEQALFERYGRSEKLSNLPNAEFSMGGDFDTLAREAGYASGKAVANDLNLWGASLEEALTTIDNQD